MFHVSDSTVCEENSVSVKIFVSVYAGFHSVPLDIEEHVIGMFILLNSDNVKVFFFSFRRALH